MQNDILCSEEVYEALYIIKKVGLQRLNYKNSSLKKSAIDALHRILKITNLNTINDIDNLLKKHKTKALDLQAEELYTKLCTHNGGSFFDNLTDEEKHIYHHYNYDISYNYGVSLAKLISFKDKSVLDIGGSSGGLCAGISGIFKHLNSTVFDTIEACKIGEELNKRNLTNIKFIEGDFFKPVNLKPVYDYIILSNVIHDWNDNGCICIFKNLRKLLIKTTKLVIHEDILSNGGLTPKQAVIYGLRLSANVPEGKQRTIEEIIILIKSAINRDVTIQQIFSFDVHSAIVIRFG